MKQDLVIIKIIFTTLGIGHYTYTEQHGPDFPGRRRLWGEIPFRGRHAATGQMLIQIDESFMRVA